jgi:hypothetical protein
LTGLKEVGQWRKSQTCLREAPLWLDEGKAPSKVSNELNGFQVIALPHETASLPPTMDPTFLKDGPYQEGKSDGGIHIDSGIGRFFSNFSPGFRLFEGASRKATPFGIVCGDLKGVSMAAFFLKQEFAHRPQLLNIVLRNSSPNINRSGRRSLLLQLGDFIIISNLIDDESVRGTFLSSMEEGQADADGAEVFPAASKAETE